MTPDQAADLAARTLAAMQEKPYAGSRHIPADRERVASDLAGLRECWVHHEGDRPFGFTALMATRYAAGLRRTAALYGVWEPTVSPVAKEQQP